MMRISKEFLESQIQSEVYDTVPDTTVTTCRLHLKNGFIAFGKSACLNPDDFNEAMGKRTAYADAFSKLWELYGFAALQKGYEAGAYPMTNKEGWIDAPPKEGWFGEAP